MKMVKKFVKTIEDLILYVAGSTLIAYICLKFGNFNLQSATFDILFAITLLVEVKAHFMTQALLQSTKFIKQHELALLTAFILISMVLFMLFTGLTSTTNFGMPSNVFQLWMLTILIPSISVTQIISKMFLES